ncbi:hypothetical protein [Roseateles sp.]|uniref:hypothetical protein n=1 Tax=Roseateles sp. TaxID=1971397 RepID=UPI0025F87910|nr:hypothetical protein [Roseateles sp.]MBV8034656.1 hypothetical protein [Roseateles sp.]
MRNPTSPSKPPIAAPSPSREEALRALLRLEQLTPWTTRRLRSALLQPPSGRPSV